MLTGLTPHPKVLGFPSLYLVLFLSIILSLSLSPSLSLSLFLSHYHSVFFLKFFHVTVVFPCCFHSHHLAFFFAPLCTRAFSWYMVHPLLCKTQLRFYDGYFQLQVNETKMILNPGSIFCTAFIHSIYFS